MELKERLLNHLKTVIDPELGMNIVELGLIYRLEIKPEGVEVDFTLTSPFCPLGDEIRNDIVRAVMDILPQANVSAELVWIPQWSPEQLSDEMKLNLGFPIY